MVIKILPSGDIAALYNDCARPLFDSLGNTRIERASNIEFKEGSWFIMDNRGEPLIDKGFYLRQCAVEAEIALLEKTL